MKSNTRNILAHTVHNTQTLSSVIHTDGIYAFVHTASIMTYGIRKKTQL